MRTTFSDFRSLPAILATAALPALALPACSADDPAAPAPACVGAKCDLGNDGDSCEAEGRYQNGTCDADCALPDLDCFILFDDDATAATWFKGWEAAVAAQQSRAPRTIVNDASDPRVTRMRALLDRGWASYASVYQVGALDRAPGLVVVEDEAVNAFVASDHTTKQSAWTVMVHTGLLDRQGADHAVLGVVMHELEHAVSLHAVP